MARFYPRLDYSAVLCIENTDYPLRFTRDLVIPHLINFDLQPQLSRRR